MRVVALISGGKDSCFNMMHCVAEGHEIVALANLWPEEIDEMDSYMYQTVGHHAIMAYGEAMDLPLFREPIHGKSVNQKRDYEETRTDEVEDLYRLLQKIKKEIEFQGVSVGAILSDYQRVRVENVCSRLGLTSLAYLWRRDQSELLQEMADCGLEAVIIKVAALGLSPKKHLGHTLTTVQDDLFMLRDKYGINPCGEGGEYETFTVDCPLFKKRITIETAETVMHSEDPVSQVAYLNLKKVSLHEKNTHLNKSQAELVMDVPLKRSSMFIDEFIQSGSLLQSSMSNLPADNACYCPPTAGLMSSSSGRILSSADGFFTSVAWCAMEDETPRDIQPCVQEALNNLKEHLSQLGATLQNLISVNLYVRKMSEFTLINEVYRRFFGINPPVRACIEVSLPINVPVMIDSKGFLSNLRKVEALNYCNESTPHKTMHVQGISHWAPANIGPYSQSVVCPDVASEGRVFVAGQIGLVPGSMEMISGGVRAESCLALRHAERILQASVAGCELCCADLVICYVCCRQAIPGVKHDWEEALKNSHVTTDDIYERGVAEPILEIVIVPALPRNASVEWQINASLVFSPTKVVKSRAVEGSITAWSKLLWRPAGNSPNASLLCRAVSSTPAVCDVNDVLMACVKCIRMCIMKSSSEGVVFHLNSFRTFYDCRVIDVDQLLAAYHEVKLEQEWCLTFIPVYGLEVENCVLSMCHW